VGLILHPFFNLEKYFAQKPFLHGLLALSPPCFVLSCRGPCLAVGLLPDIKSKFKHKRKETDMPLQDKRSLSYLKQYLSIVDWGPVLNDNTPAAFEKFEAII
jgi:hypothetical protein